MAHPRLATRILTVLLSRVSHHSRGSTNHNPGAGLALTFAEWLGAQMDRRGIRSGRRLSSECGIDEMSVLDWAIGRRVPRPEEVDVLVRFFGANGDEAHSLRDRSEAAMPRKGQRTPA